MKTFVIACMLFSVTITAYAQIQQIEKPLLGGATIKNFQEQPYADWYTSGYETYQPANDVVQEIKKIKSSKTSVLIVFGTWCGDSKRELPRMLKTLHTAGFGDHNIQLLGVAREASVYKQAPNREEKDLYVYRVPTCIVYEKGKEIGRVNEFPVESFERDLLKILKHEAYTPSYKSFGTLSQWQANGLLRDANASIRGMAEQLRGNVMHEGELNTCGYVLLAQKSYAEAITVFRINVNLYPQSSNCYDSLAEAHLLAGNIENAKVCYQYALELDPKNENAKTQLDKLK